MKSITVKKVAAVAAGTAMLVGAALAATVPALEKGFFVDSNGNANAQIVVGSNAAVSDGIAAANLAAVVGGKAYVETSGGEEVTVLGADIGATGKASVQTGSTTTSGSGSSIQIEPGAATYEDSIYTANNGGVWILTTANAAFLKSGTLTGDFTTATGSEEYTYSEQIRVGTSTSTTTGIRLYYSEDTDKHGIYWFASPPASNTNTEYGEVEYELYFNTPVFDRNTPTGAPEIYFLGEKHIVNGWDVDGGKITLIKGSGATLGVGQSTDMTVGEDTYTVTLNDASLNEVSSIGQASITVKKGTTEQTIALDTSSTRDATVGGLYVFLESVAKSYTPGQGGTAKLRMGGEKLALEDGALFSGNNEWKVRFVTDSAGTSLQRIRVALSETYDLNDKATTIKGPKDYFQIVYSGPTAPATENIEITTSNYKISKFTYPDKEGTLNEVEVQDSSNIIKTFFQEMNSTNYTVALTTDKYFIIDDEVVRYQSYDSTGTTVGDVRITLKTYGDEAVSYNPSAFYPTSTDRRAAYFDAITVAGTTVDAVLILDSTVNETTAWAAMNASGRMWASRLGMKNASAFVAGQLFVDTNNDGVVNTALNLNTKDGHYINVQGLGAAYDVGGTNVYVNLTEYGSSSIASQGYMYVYSVNVSSNEGMYVNSNKNWINGAAAAGNLTVAMGTTAGYDNNKYGYTAWGTSAETTTTKTTLKMPKEAVKLNVFVGQPAGSTVAGEIMYTLPGWTADEYLTNFECAANDYTYKKSAGVEFGNIGTIVVDDNTQPTGNAIVIGGHMVNKLAVGVTEGELTASGGQYVAFSDTGKTLYVAGYTATDTMGAVNDLITAVKAL
ncbi:MAG: S-layer protein [Candidatus Diapherotrites archaeon]|nr:S-layer protein [Candidatus Diapherotrites archaeon]